MRFPEKTVTLKDGRTCVLRPTDPAYAAEMVAYMKETAGETPFLLRYPDEVNYTVESEREILGRILDDPGQAMMMALVDGRVAGNASIGGHGPKRKVRHRCSLAIALYREFWGLGIGTAMIAYLEALARQIGYGQMDLEVVADNAQARALYRKCGFEETGRHARALLFDDGTYHDEILMTKVLGEAGARP